MRVVVLGLGYVGSVCAACLARDGFEVIGIDVNESKVRSVESGRSPVLEPGLDGLIREGKRRGRLRATTDFDDGAREADAFDHNPPARLLEEDAIVLAQHHRGRLAFFRVGVLQGVLHHGLRLGIHFDEVGQGV